MGIPMHTTKKTIEYNTFLLEDVSCLRQPTHFSWNFEVVEGITCCFMPTRSHWTVWLQSLVLTSKTESFAEGIVTSAEDPDVGDREEIHCHRILQAMICYQFYRYYLISTQAYQLPPFCCFHPKRKPDTKIKQQTKEQKATFWDPAMGCPVGPPSLHPQIPGRVVLPMSLCRSFGSKRLQVTFLIFFRL